MQDKYVDSFVSAMNLDLDLSVYFVLTQFVASGQRLWRFDMDMLEIHLYPYVDTYVDGYGI